MLWQENWDAARANHIQWWRHEGLVLWVTAPKDKPWADVPDPGPVRDGMQKWYDPVWRTQHNIHNLATTYFGGDALPIFSTWAGAGDIAGFLGSRLEVAKETVWFHPCITDPDQHPALRLDSRSDLFRKEMALVEAGLRAAQGHFLVSQPDLVENLDILASLRGSETVLLDLIERPDWVCAKLHEINQAFFAAFDAFYNRIKDPWGGNCFVFNIWGPGRTAKVQCDASAMISPGMFRQFVLPPLREQCDWLDYAMYHLDGETALQHLDILLHEIPELDAIEWTPMFCYANEGGGKPKWYDLYRRILRAGKSVQAICVQYDEVIPLLDAVGGQGLFITTHAPTEDAARELEEKVNAYR